MQRISVQDTLGHTYAMEMFENDDTADSYWLEILGGESILDSLRTGTVMVVREEMFKGTWVETCRKLVVLEDSA